MLLLPPPYFVGVPAPAPNHSFFSYCFLQLENLGNFIKAILAYGLKPNDIFEANDLFENGNMTQVQTTLLALASMVSEHAVQRATVYWGTHFLLLLETNRITLCFVVSPQSFDQHVLFVRQRPKVWTQSLISGWNMQTNKLDILTMRRSRPVSVSSACR